MSRARGYLTSSPRAIAGTYLLFGILWIVVTDVLAANLTTTEVALTRLQTIKGWAFVLVSTALLAALLVSRERQLGEERSFTELALNSLTDIFIVLGENGRIQRMNQRAVAVTGYDESELLDSAATRYIAPDDRAAVASAVSTAYERGQAQVEATVVSKDGGRIQYEFRGHRMEEGDGTLRGLAITGRDITDRVLNEQQLSVALRLLRHNLRNKLNVIDGWVTTIDEPEKRATAREKIHESVEDLLDMSQKTRTVAEIGDEDATAEVELDVANQVTSTVDEFREHHPTVTFETDVPEKGGTVVSSGSQLDTALRNALENAIEHNDAADPWVRVEVSRSQGGAEISIHDNGPGIPANERAVLEEGIETQLDHSSGVGLWLVNWSVTSLGGTVELEDGQPRGSIVTLSLPTTTRP